MAGTSSKDSSTPRTGKRPPRRPSVTVRSHRRSGRLCAAPSTPSSARRSSPGSRTVTVTSGCCHADGMSHGGEENRRIAETGTILRVLVGSGVHGTAVEGQDDRDEMGICIEGPEYVIGLRSFEQYQFRTQPEGVRSGPGDLDLTIYSLRKWLRLALQGNPTVLLPLFVPDEHIIAC